MSNLKDKVAVVTGASKGIGAAIAKRLSEAGAAVVVNYSSESDLILRPMFQALARRRESTRMLARSTHASALAIVFSKSLDNRRQRLSQASVRSTTQRLRSGLNEPTLCKRVIISMVHLPNSASASGSCLPR